MEKNPLEMRGIEFVELASSSPSEISKLLFEFGFSKTKKHATKNIDFFVQHQIRFLLNYEKDSFASSFQKAHGPSVSAMGWRFKNPLWAYTEALTRGARPATRRDHFYQNGRPIPAIYGIGDSLIYFLDDLGPEGMDYEKLGFLNLQDPIEVPQKGFLQIDHLTNNVYKGTMKQWKDFYQKIFGFEEVRTFDIQGKRTGLQSYALRSPCRSFCIPINEANEKKSQINEYLEEYRGPGVQHLAFLTDDILASVSSLQGTSIQLLDTGPDYYSQVFNRVPNVSEDHKRLEDLQILVDGDQKGYLLQIFTKNLIGPIFIEIIQRKNHLSFGEGNFQALFDSIERDQMRRGVFRD